MQNTDLQINSVLNAVKSDLQHKIRDKREVQDKLSTDPDSSFQSEIQSAILTIDHEIYGIQQAIDIIHRFQYDLQADIGGLI